MVFQGIYGTAHPEHRRKDGRVTMEAIKRKRAMAAKGGPGPGSRLPAAARQSHIAEVSNTHGFVSVTALATELNVSTMTIRRDIASLERRGLLRRTHGGAVALDVDPDVPRVAEPPFADRASSHVPEKQAIARAAAELVGPNQAIGIDVGSTAHLLATELTRRGDLRVVTNSLHAALRLSESDNRVYLLGGALRGPECSLVGPEAIVFAGTWYLDLVFLGVSGVDQNGCYDYSPEDSEVKRAYAEQAGRTVILCDSSKFDDRAMAKVLPLDGVDMLVTDAAPRGNLAKALKAASVDVIVASA